MYDLAMTVSPMHRVETMAGLIVGLVFVVAAVLIARLFRSAR